MVSYVFLNPVKLTLMSPTSDLQTGVSPVSKHEFPWLPGAPTVGNQKCVSEPSPVLDKVRAETESSGLKILLAILCLLSLIKKVEEL